MDEPLPDSKSCGLDTTPLNKCEVMVGTGRHRKLGKTENTTQTQKSKRKLKIWNRTFCNVLLKKEESSIAFKPSTKKKKRDTF